MSKKTGLRKRQKRAALFAQQRGLCHWCQQPMIFQDWVPPGTQLANTCTLDHLRDKFDPLRRMRPTCGERRLVAACYSCNQDRGAARVAEMQQRASQGIEA